MRRQVLTASVVAMAVIPLGAGPASAAPAKAPTAASESRALVSSTKALSKKTPKRARLIVLANRIKSQQAKQPCEAIKTINLYRGAVQKLPKSSRKRAVSTDARALALSQRLLRSKRAAACGGGAGPATVLEATPAIGRSAADGLDVSVKLPEVNLSSVDRGGKLWTELSAKGTDAPQLPGQPAIPVAAYSVAVPDGATLEATAVAGASYTLPGVDVVPAQPDPVDAGSDTPAPNFRAGAFMDGKFVGPGDAYKGGIFPAKPADASVVGSARGLSIATLQIPLAQYDPRKKTLQVHRSVDIKLSFKGGSGFGADGGGGPWDKFGMSLASGVMNGDLISKLYVERKFIPRPCGEEFLIITNPSTRASADRLSVARNLAGIRTRVYETGAGAGRAGTTASEIQAFVRSHVTRLFCVRPGYLLMVGNDELVPTFEISGATSDLPYALSNDADNLPDIASGRIPGKDDAEVGTAIDKIIAYETNPLPAGVGQRALVAAQFQDDNNDGREDRTFAQFGETVSKGLEARGLSVTRVYGEDPAPANSDPRFFNDGTPLPASLKKPGFGWNGTGVQVTTAWNDGVFLAIHRDHGWSDGWGTPGFTTANVEALTNTALPVMMSINCSSGAYDRDDTSFATRSLVRPGGGAVAVFGDTEDSPSWHNTQLGFGFVDALLPSVLPSEGPAQAQRLGDALVHGKMRLNGLAPAASDGSTLFEMRIWHLFGDPTMRMRGGSKFRFPFPFPGLVLKYERRGLPGPPPEEINPNYQVVLAGLPGELNGQTIGLRKGGDVVGQALVVDGAATVPAIFGDGSVRPNELSVVIDAPTDDPPVTLTVPSDRAASTLSQTCPKAVQYDDPMTVTGQLLGAAAGAEVNVTFTPPATVGAAPRPAVEQTVKTDEAGKFTAAHVPTQSGFGTWKVQSAFAGSETVAPSTSESCDVNVTRGEVIP